MTEIIISDKRTYILPGIWNELTEAQLTANAEDILLYATLTTNADKFYLKTKIAFNLCGLQFNENSEFLINEIQTKLLPCIEWLFLDNQLTEQLIPKVRIRKGFLLHGLCGPSSNFNNLSFEEFDDAEFFFARLSTADVKAQEEALNMLCAILYREHSDAKKGDNRIDYSPHDNEKRAEWFAHCEMKTKLAIMLWYIGCRTRLTTDFAPLFESKSDKGGSTTWTEIAHSIAGPVLGDLDKVFKRPVRQIFVEMMRLHLQGEELKEREEANKV
jgi:hypothetical protein